MAKNKNKKSKKQTMKEGRKFIASVRKETRLDTLRGLLQMVNEGITIDALALEELISDVEGATVPLKNFYKEADLNDLEPAGENVWVPKVDDGEIHAVPQGHNVGVDLAGFAERIGVNRQTLTAFLRRNFPGDAPGTGGSWVLTPAMTDAIGQRWSDEILAAEKK